MKARYILIIFISYIAISCGVQLYLPTSDDVVVQKQLNEGRELYINYCGSCHNLHLPQEYNREQWKGYLDKMQSKAKINEGQKSLIYNYLISHP